MDLMATCHGQRQRESWRPSKIIQGARGNILGLTEPPGKSKTRDFVSLPF